MNWTVSNRLEGIGEYYFSTKLREIDELNKAGKGILNLGIGSPDLPPHPDVVKVLQVEASKDNQHSYQSYKGVPVLREAVANWYKKYFKVADINPATEILPLLGSKEGIMHICMTYLYEGDQVLIPNPGYPTYTSAVKFLSKVKLMWVNYPHMPTGQRPTKELFEKIVAFGIKHQILICHDNPYAFILNDKPESLLSIDRAKEVVIELNSLSKSQNMAGWRVGMLIAAEDRINEILRFKSNMDSGMFLPVQLAAAKALSLDQSWYDSVNKIYTARREKVFELLDVLKCVYTKQQVGMFVWAKIPATYKDGYALSDKVLYDANVFITPGGIFGSAGNEYIRVSLCGSIEKFSEAIKRIEACV
ncbi:MAG: aminotransferase class I/II-fold pyridoxal phosphate-dependent enzyme [Sediminibacterium sp.]|nr:aminotransferase class I/II-fold pyridoxal phosphate-dependent enzyme [Sediminibacterium sp.]